MLYDILPIILIILSLGAIIFILMKKMPQVRAVDVKRIPKEVQSEVKKNLIEKKIERKLADFGEKFKPMGQAAGKALGDYLKQFKKRMSALESRYREEKNKSKRAEPEVLAEEISSLLKEAAILVGEGKLEEAEKKYLQVISLDSRNIVAYAKLGEIYYKEKEFEGARQAMEYVMTLARQGYGELEVEDFFLLTLIYEETGDFKKAFRCIKEAVGLEPNNPRNLDFLCKISIIIKDKKEAGEACERLREVNPENEKVEEYRREIRKM